MANKNMPASEMTKRERVASMALQALIETDKTKAWSMDDKVREAIAYADLLFKELEK